MSDQKFIKDFEILIGQDGFRVFEPMLCIIINDRATSVSLTEFTKWVNTIAESKGDRNEKAYKAFDQFKSFFAQLLSPYIDYSAMITNKEKE